VCLRKGIVTMCSLCENRGYMQRSCTLVLHIVAVMGRTGDIKGQTSFVEAEAGAARALGGGEDLWMQQC
jgi:hypothetical protein